MVKPEIRLLLAGLLLFSGWQEMLPRAGRGGSYRSSSSGSSYRSSSSSSRSSSSSYSSSRSYSSGSSYSSTRSYSTYSGPTIVTSLQPLLDRYELSVRLLKSGKIQVKEKFAVTYTAKQLTKDIRFMIHPRPQALWQLNIQSLEVSGTDLKNARLNYSGIQLEMTDTKRLKQSGEITYTIENGVLPFGSNAKFFLSFNPTYRSGTVEAELPTRPRQYLQFLAAGKDPHKSPEKRLAWNDKKAEGSGNFSVEAELPSSAFDDVRKIQNAFPDYQFISRTETDLEITRYSTFRVKTEQKLAAGSGAYSHLMVNSRHGDGDCNQPVYYTEIEGDLRTGIWMDYWFSFPEGTRIRRFGFTMTGNYCSANGRRKFIFILPVPAGEKVFTESWKVTLKRPDFLRGKELLAEAFRVKNTDYYFSRPERLAKASPKISLTPDSLTIWDDSGIIAGENIEIVLDLPDEFSDWPVPFLRYGRLWIQATYFLGGEYYWALRIWPIVIFLVFLLFIRIIRKRLKKKAEYKQQAAAEQAAERKLEDDIRKLDPAFDPVEFRRITEEAFLLVQKSWSEGRMEAARSFLSRGLVHKLRIQLKMMTEQEGIRNVIAEASVLEEKILSFQQDGEYLIIHMKLKARIRESDVNAALPLNQAMELAKTGSVEVFEEIYSFIRKKDAIGKAGSIWKNQCPGCGKQADRKTDSNLCDACGRIYSSAEFDWVLSEISQVDEWSGTSRNTGDGQCAQMMEDRATHLFWIWLYAWSTGNGSLLKRHAEPEITAKISGKNPVHEPVSGAADLQSFSEEGAGWQAAVKVHFSAAFSGDHEPRYRGALVRMNLKNPEAAGRYGMADRGCPHCGAPLPDADRPDCAYCNTALPEFAEDWRLSELSLP